MRFRLRGDIIIRDGDGDDLEDDDVNALFEEFVNESELDAAFDRWVDDYTEYTLAWCDLTIDTSADRPTGPRPNVSPD